VERYLISYGEALVSLETGESTVVSGIDSKQKKKRHGLEKKHVDGILIRS
jgi:hypothetical protein